MVVAEDSGGSSSVARQMALVIQLVKGSDGSLDFVYQAMDGGFLSLEYHRKYKPNSKCPNALMVIMVRHFFQSWVLVSKVRCIDGNWSMGWCVTQDSRRQVRKEWCGIRVHFRNGHYTLIKEQSKGFWLQLWVEMEEPVETGDWGCWEVGIPFIGLGLELGEQCWTPVREVLSSIPSTEKQNINNKILEGPGRWRTRAPGKGWPKCSLHG